MRIILFICFIFIYPAFAQEQTSPPSYSFSNLESYLGVKYNPKNSEIVNKTLGSYPKDHPLFTDEFEANDIVILKTKFHSNDQVSFYVVFSEGPSGDPNFYFLSTSLHDKVFGYLGCEEIVIPGNGFVYTKCRANKDYLKRRKYKVEDTGFKEITQPYYYVGLKSRTLAPITIYKEKDTKEPIAKLPSNYAIEVLISDENSYYLVKTTFGLVGWIHLPSAQYNNEIIKGIYFQGD